MSHLHNYLAVLSITALLYTPVVPAQEHDHAHEEEHETAAHVEEQAHGHDDEHGHDEHGETTTVNLSEGQRQTADIHLETLQPMTLSEQVYAPGEIKVNGYRSYIVSPRVSSVVTARHAALGEKVTSGQPLVTLFSEEMITAQSQLQQAYVEWQRVSKLGQSAVGEKRLVSARTEYNAANRRLQALGLSGATIARIEQNTNYPLGEYTLTAQTPGLIMTDEFNQGQRIEPGQPLMLLSDEAHLWVEARLSAQNDLHLQPGDQASVVVGDIAAIGTVIQESHTIDPVSRTRTVRLELDNQAHRFHSGMFVDIYFNGPQTDAILAVPQSALMRDGDGEWQIYIADDDGDLIPQGVTLGPQYGDWQAISGVKPGQTYVSHGAFFVASEIAKGGFDPHNH
ncbi:efflux RND transporter periplasmic adaptor subunit [uncultured Alteromonas sp.]|jgi:RND family efflux transporter MFP subunit|uniref:efflux RND transporter periplasmic adaptor subunit n=1 Tax=uncultured Alteromonas sp. TaxID=179113 RepID=UPI0025F50D3A|nr:efflux RND transporter periplasmic adaptor subunit [uncultured Alteromonas sp.]